MIYLASPYSHDEATIRGHRFNEVLKCVAHFTRQQILVYSPIVHNHPVNMELGADGSWEFWQEHDMAMLLKCDTFYILKLPGWEESVGVKAETQAASNMLMPIYEVDHETYDLRPRTSR